MAGITALAVGVISAGISAVNTINANDQAGKTAQEETQLLNEANQQQAQEQESLSLISQRTAQESEITPLNPKFTGSGTIGTGPLGIIPPLPASTGGKNLQLLGT
jgi:hypothetical protein